MSNTSDECRALAAALGRREMAGRLGVGLKAISNAVVEGAFPPSWYFVLRQLAAEKGAKCPAKLFAFKSPFKDGEGTKGSQPVEKNTQDGPFTAAR